MKPLHRHAAERLHELLASSPAVLVLGPRQCGKSTLVRTELDGWHHVDLERQRDHDRIAGDIEGFFAAHPDHVVIDEAQRLPQLFTSLRPILDEDRRPGRVVLLGSASPTILRGVSETLAGRLGILELSPFRPPEIAGLPWARQRWFWGGLPPVLLLRSEVARRHWLDAYVTTFVEREIQSFGYSFLPQRIRKLLAMLTHVHGRLLNVSDLARSLSITPNTVNEYLDVLEGAFLIRRVQPHFANVQKRLTKRPKLYLRDTGLLHFLAGLDAPEQLEDWPYRGLSFESLVIEELASLAEERVVRPHLAFWRTAVGAEVDLLIKDGTRLYPIEIKLGSSVAQHDVSSLRSCMHDLGLEKGWVVYGGPEFYGLGSDIEVVPWSAIASGQFDFGLGGKKRAKTKRPPRGKRS
jgi:predicted AAA+ superfamily ATPase